MRLLYVGMMAELVVEPTSIDIMATLEVAVTSTLFLVPNSLLYFNPEEKVFMRILRPS